MPSLFARSEPFHEDGIDARRRHRRQRVVSLLAFLLSLSATLGAVAMWAAHLGVIRVPALG